jgi:hypothetical protein
MTQRAQDFMVMVMEWLIVLWLPVVVALLALAAALYIGRDLNEDD